MKTLFRQPFLMLVATIVTTVILAACSNEMNPTDVSAGEPQAVAVRFTTPSAGQAAAENSWQEDDQVKVTPEAEPNGAITFKYTKQEDGTYAWQNSIAGGDNFFKTILPAGFTAYYPVTEGTDGSIFTLPNISNGYADQSSAVLLHAADYMTSLATTVSVGEGVLNLTLAHRLCRLTFIVTEYGNEFNGVPTLEDVKILSQNRSVRLGYNNKDQFEVSPEGKWTWVSPFIGTNAGGKLTYTAIITPNLLFSDYTNLMLLTVNDNELPVVYKGNLTELVSGSAYTFHLKVGKDYVTVTESKATEWIGTETDVTSDDIFTASDLKIGDYYYYDGTTSDGGLRKLYRDGTYDMEDIKPDLSDGRTVLGIVMKVGKDSDGKWKDDGEYMLKGTTNPMSTIRGYVLALKDASIGNNCHWGSYGENVETDREQNTGFYGYTNTNKIKAFATQNGNNLETAFPATYYATEGYENANPAPDNSSGWFLPSAGQCKFWFDNKAVLLESIRKATSKNNYNWYNYYWSSSEYNIYPRSRVWCLVFNEGSLNGLLKDDYNYVQSILAF